MRRSESDELFWSTIHYLLVGMAFLSFVISAAFIISVWLTKLLFRMVNELTDGEIDRNEGVGLLISAVVFGALALLFLPAVSDPTVPVEQLVGGLLLAGMCWGLAVGYKVLVDWWHEMEMMSLSSSSFTQTFNLPEQHYLPPGGPQSG